MKMKIKNGENTRRSREKFKWGNNNKNILKKDIWKQDQWWSSNQSKNTENGEKKVQKLCIQMQYKIPATIYIYKVLHKKLSAQYSRQYGAHMDTQNNKKYTDPKIDQEKTDAHKGPSSRK